MGLLYPAGLFLLASIPLLVIAYMVRERPQRLIVSSVIAFRALGGLKGDRPWGLPKLDWMFFVEALILALAALALAGPYVVHRRSPIAVVLDNSAAMQALAHSGRPRFEEARDQLAAALRSVGSSGEISVYSTAPLPRLIAGPLLSIAAAESALNRIALTDSPDDVGVVERSLADLGSGKRFSKLLFGGSRSLSPPFPDRIRAITIDDSLPNFALGSFVLRRESLGTDVLHGRITIANFSSRATTLVVSIDGDGKPVANAQARLEPREVGALDFPSLAPANSYRANLTPRDGFELDNAAYATASAARSIEILFVTPTPNDALSLNSLPGVHVLTQTPEHYQPDQAAKADLVIFEYTVPKDLPPTNALLVMPPQGDPIFRFSVYPASNVQITGWKAPEALTDGVNLKLLQPSRGEYFELHPWMEPLISGSNGGLVLSGERQGHRFVAVGFNLFPYLGSKNLPMSLLTLNALSYLAGLGADSAGYRTGEPWLVPTGIVEIVMPSGERLAVKGGTLFRGAVFQGIYKLIGAGGETTFRAVNLNDLAESDLESTTPLKIEPQAEGAASAKPLTSVEALSRYLILALLVISAFEAIVAYRKHRSGTRFQV